MLILIVAVIEVRKDRSIRNGGDSAAMTSALNEREAIAL